MSEFASGYLLHFSDGGEPEEMLLCRGTKAQCEQALASPPLAIAYSGDRRGLQLEPVLVEVPDDWESTDA